MAYTITLKASAAKAIEALTVEDRKRVVAAIEALATDPRPVGAKPMKGEKGMFRVRVGDFRILYVITDRTLSVLIVRVANRREVYRKAKRMKKSLNTVGKTILLKNLKEGLGLPLPSPSKTRPQ